MAARLTSLDLVNKCDGYVAVQYIDHNHVILTYT
jgi:hypothetical protein